MKLIKLSFLYFTFLFTIHAQAQAPNIDSFLNQKKYAEAYQLCKQQINHFIDAGNIDTLIPLTAKLGESATAYKNFGFAQSEINQLIAQAKSKFGYHYRVFGLYLEASDFYSNNNDYQLAYDNLIAGEKYFVGHEHVLDSSQNIKEYNLGNMAMSMGNYGLAKEHFNKSLHYLKNQKITSYEKLYFTNNSLGIVNWYSSQLDTAVYYFGKAVDALNKAEATDLNRHYRVAIVQNNMAGCYNSLGRPKDAILMYTEIIAHFKAFAASPEAKEKGEKAKMLSFQSIDNLAKVYLDMGNYTRGYDLLNYSYQQKKNFFGEDNIEVGKSMIFLGNVLSSTNEYKKSKDLIEQAIELFKNNGDTSSTWVAEGYSILARNYENLHQNEKAHELYNKAYALNLSSYGEAVDESYLHFLSNYAQFLAEHRQPSITLAVAHKALNIVLKAQGEFTPQTALQLRSLAQLNYTLENYPEVLKVSARGIKAVAQMITNGKSIEDSIRMGMEMPPLILYQNKAKYQLLQSKDSTSLQLILQNLREAQVFLEQRKTILSEDIDLNFLNESSKSLTEFIKKITYELYELTGKASLIDQIISTHEDGIYARIRNRMNKQKAIQFAGVPANILEEETQLKQALKTTLQDTTDIATRIQKYLAVTQKWDEYQSKIKEQYPAYYHMRYDQESKTLNQIKNFIPKDVVVIRYIYADDYLLALVLSNDQHKLYQLKHQNLTELITTLNNAEASQNDITAASYHLYQQLWQPFEKNISQQRVVIIPDGILYNLSFEMLSTESTKDYATLMQKSLLQKHAFSYHYSLWALEKSKEATSFKGNFIGFAPEFTDQQKAAYSAQLKQDSVHLDFNYLSLLPLPFTSKTLDRINEKVQGKIFVNNQSTKSAFKNKAGNHKVIFIGTHAESNNNYPEYSRLIFAKDPLKNEEENSLYLYDIYNCNLNSNIAILSACETGRPGYQDGEGMISMSHAFSYAGSESILTGLWKIDEQTTAQITELFFNNLAVGQTKDQALRQAKLDFLKQQDGRLLAPHYWAGLVIMGDTTPIIFDKASNTLYWILGGLAAALAGVWLMRKKKSS